MTVNPKVVLTIAGSDSGGGAGIQADLKTFAWFGCHGLSAISVLTAQNTTQVSAIHELPAEFVEDQLSAVLEDFKCDAVKIGMLYSPAVVQSVAKTLKDFNIGNIVLDPVMIATSGSKLVKNESLESMVECLFPLATVVTPNVFEAGVLAGKAIASKDDFPAAAKHILDQGAQAVLIKGGHLDGGHKFDLLDQGKDEPAWFSSSSIDTKNTHGTGCTLSSAIASGLALGKNLYDAVVAGRDYVQQALLAAKDQKLGQGNGPLAHFF